MNGTQSGFEFGGRDDFDYDEDEESEQEEGIFDSSGKDRDSEKKIRFLKI